MTNNASWDETQRTEQNDTERKDRVKTNDDDVTVDGLENRVNENHTVDYNAVDATADDADDADDATAVVDGDVENDGNWKRAHAALTRFAKARAKMDWEEAQLLLWALRSGSHSRLGYATFPEYVERLLGYGPRFTSEKVRVAEALEALPELNQALKDGELNWSALRELTRVAVPKTEREWREVALGKTAREVERLVSGRRPGDRPSDGSDPRVRRHVLRFEVSGETLAVFRDALARIRRATAGPLDDDGSLLLMARLVLGGPRDEGRANYQIQLMVCESCGRAEQLGKGERIPIAPEVLAMCRCDAQHTGGSHMGDETAGRTDTSARERSEEAECTLGNSGPEPAEQPASEMPKSEMPKSEMPKCRNPKCRNPKCRNAEIDVHELGAAGSNSSSDSACDTADTTCDSPGCGVT